MRQPKTIEPLVDAYELGSILHVAFYTVSRMRKLGRIPFHRLGPKRYRYRVSDVLKALSISSEDESEE